MIRIYIDSAKVIFYAIIIFIVISCLILVYKFFQYTPELDTSLVNRLSENGWFYSPEEIYFVNKGNYLLAKEVKTDKIKWDFELSKNTDFDNSAISPVFANEITYLTIASSLFALDINTGKPRWTFIGEEHIDYSSDIDNKVIYFVNRNGYFHALNAITGKEKWHFNIKEISPKIKESVIDKKNNALPNSFKDPGNIISKENPIKTPGLKLTMKFEKGQKQDSYNYFYKFYQLTDEGKKLLSFNARKASEDQIIRPYDKILNLHNKEILSQDNNVNFKAGNLSKSLIAFNNTLYFNYKENNINFFYSIESKHLKFNWKLKYEPSEFITTKDISYFEENNYLYAIDNKTGKEIWKFNEHGALAKLIFKDGIIYIQDSLYSIYALDSKTGEQLWYFKSKDLIFSPLVVNNSVYFTLSGFNLTSESYLYVLDSISGQFKWKLKLNKNEWIYSMNVNNGKVFLITSFKKKVSEYNFISEF